MGWWYAYGLREASFSSALNAYVLVGFVLTEVQDRVNISNIDNNCNNNDDDGK